MSPTPKRPSRSTLAQMVAFLILLIAAFAYRTWQEQVHKPPFGYVGPGYQIEVVTSTPTRPASPPQAATSTGAATVPAGLPPASGLKKFDYYVLALSWSPEYCDSSGSQDPQECAIGKKLGFVLHGLWPQNNAGYPSNCSTEKLTAAVKAQFPGLYPNDSLYEHEWEKHGTCTGLSASQYLSLAKQLKGSLEIPADFQAPQQPFRATSAQLKQEFTQANPGFTSANFEVNCSGSGRYMEELYVCFSRDGQPVACGSELHKNALKSCQQADFLVRNTR